MVTHCRRASVAARDESPRVPPTQAPLPPTQQTHRLQWEEARLRLPVSYPPRSRRQRRCNPHPWSNPLPPERLLQGMLPRREHPVRRHPRMQELRPQHLPLRLEAATRPRQQGLPARWLRPIRPEAAQTPPEHPRPPPPPPRAMLPATHRQRQPRLRGRRPAEPPPLRMERVPRGGESPRPVSPCAESRSQPARRQPRRSRPHRVTARRCFQWWIARYGGRFSNGNRSASTGIRPHGRCRI